DNDFRDVLGIWQPHVRPTVAAIRRFVDAGANGHAVARPGFPRARPDGFRRLRVNGHRADGLRGFFVKNRFERRPAVRRFPHAPAGCSNVDREPAILFYSRDGGDAPAHRGGTDVPRAQAGDRVGVEFRVLPARGHGEGHRREKQHHQSSKAADCLAHIGGVLASKLEATTFGCKSIHGYPKARPAFFPVFSWRITFQTAAPSSPAWKPALKNARPPAVCFVRFFPRRIARAKRSLFALARWQRDNRCRSPVRSPRSTPPTPAARRESSFESPLSAQETSPRRDSSSARPRSSCSV